MLRIVADILSHRRTEGWLVGGSVRDRELARYSPDLDVVVADDPAAVAQEIALSLDAPWFSLSERHQAYRVMGRGGHVDVAALRGRDISDDLGCRDFTVNAMAIPVGRPGLVDPFGGIEHLRQRRLVAVSEHIFEDDPLRLLRAPRFSHVLGLRLDAALRELVRSQAPSLVRSAPERVTTEMTLTLAAGRSEAAARLWRDLGLLDVMLPEAATGQFEPQLALLGALDEILADPGAWFPCAAGLLGERLVLPVDGATARPVALRLSGLVYRLPPQGSAAAGRRLKWSAAVTSLARTVSAHFSADSPPWFGSLVPALPPLSGRWEVLFLWRAAPWEPEVILLAAAVATAGGRLSAQPWQPDVTQRLMGLWAERTVEGIPRPPLDGDALMRELGLEAGPLLGRVQREVRLAWEAGEVATTTEALGVARAAAERETAPNRGLPDV